MINNELMNMNKRSIFNKIKTLFFKIKSRIFGKKTKNEMKNIYIKNTVRDEFYEDIKIQDFEKIEDIAEKERFIKKLIQNKEILNLLSIERLEMIVKYNDEIIKRNEEKIKKLKMET